MTDADQFNLITLIFTAIPAILFIYLSTALQRLNSVQIERLFDLDENHQKINGSKVSTVFTSIQFISIFFQVIFIFALYRCCINSIWNWKFVGQFFLIFLCVEIVGRQVFPNVFPIHVRDNIKTWEKWALLISSYLFYLPSVVVVKATEFSQKRFSSKTRHERMTQAEETIRSIIDAGEKDGVFLSDEGEMLQSILELSETIVREVMTPRIDIQAIEINASIDDFVRSIVETGYSKMPVFKEKVDDIVGILYAKDVLAYWKSNEQDVTLDELKRDVSFVPETKRISILLREFQQEKKHLAIVVDEFGGVAGLVTIEDLLEEIVGEIHDEYDEEEETIRSLSSSSWEVAARIDLDELSEVIGIDFPEDSYETLGGFLFHLFGRIPAPGESHSYEHMLFKISKANERRIETVIIAKELTQAELKMKEETHQND